MYMAFKDVSLCRPADNISRQFVHRSGPPIRLYILKKLSPCARYARFCIRCACSSLAITCTPSRELITYCADAHAELRLYCLHATKSGFSREGAYGASMRETMSSGFPTTKAHTSLCIRSV